jgi:hypothetical protein
MILRSKNADAYKSWSFVRRPREAGISPTSRLSSKFKLVKLDRFPNCSGMPPVILLPGKDLQNYAPQGLTKVGECGHMT